MAALRPARDCLKDVVQVYTANRRSFQGMSMAALSFYVAWTTYKGLSGGGGSPRSKAGTSSEREEHKEEEDGESHSNKAKKRRRRGPRVAVDAQFWQRLRRILAIVVPSSHSKEASLLLLHSAFLLFRTALSLYVAALDGKIVSALVHGQPWVFVKRIALWLGVALPATYCNSMLEYIQAKLALAYRSRLTNYVQHEYFSDKTFYTVGNLDDRIKNADQLVTADIHKFSTALAEIYSNIAKPTVDVILFNYQLSRHVGAEGLLALVLLVQGSAAALRALTPSFGRYAAEEQRLEGDFRFAHSRVVENAEEIALYNGQELEKHVLDRSYFGLVKHANWVLRRKLWHGVAEDFIIKWAWGSFGMCLCAVPVFFNLPGQSSSSIGADSKDDPTQSFITNRRLLLSSSDAFGRVLLSYKELAILAGYTLRMSELLDTMEDVKAGRFKKNLVGAADANQLAHRGRIVESQDDSITFDQVPIVSPNGDVLIEALSFKLQRGENLLIVGANGTGKSSIFRILGGLWTIHGGIVAKPPANAFCYIPQRPYLCLGTLRDQIIYPSTKQEMLARGWTDTDLFDILKVLQIDHMVEREGGLDAQREWRDALSGGDKQRLAMARLFYHRPKFAILDESSSAITLEVERLMYEHAVKLGITLLTVSHRPSLWQYHNKILQLDGQGGYSFGDLDPSKRLALQDEKHAIEAKLLEVPKLKERLEELTA